MLTMAHRPTLQHPQPGHNQELLGLVLLTCRHHTRPDFVQCRRLPLFEIDGGRPGFRGRITRVWFPLHDWQEMYSRESKAQFDFSEAT